LSSCSTRTFTTVDLTFWTNVGVSRTGPAGLDVTVVAAGGGGLALARWHADAAATMGTSQRT
jgi:hypothetical protein